MILQCEGFELNQRARGMARPSGSPGRQAGFSLVELLVVLVILGLLAALATPQVLKYLGRAKVDTARIEMKNMATALDFFLLDVGRYPTQQEGLQALVTNPAGLAPWRGPYLKTNALGPPLDPWGHPYQYRVPGQSGGDYDLFAIGPDNSTIALGNSQGAGPQ